LLPSHCAVQRKFAIKTVKSNPLLAMANPKMAEAENGREFRQLPDEKEKWRAWMPFDGAELCVNGCAIPAAPRLMNRRGPIRALRAA